MNNKPTTLLVLLLAVAYAFLFYHAEMGVNLFLFDGLMVATLLFARPELSKHRSFVWALGGMLFAAGCVVIIHGEAALWAHHLSYLVVLGFAQQRQLRFIWYGFLLGLITLFRAPFQWLSVQAERLRQHHQSKESHPAWRWLRQAVPALFILVPFLLFYLNGNQRLSAGLDYLLNWMDNFEVNITVFWSVSLFLFAILLLLGLFYPRQDASRLVAHQLGFNDYLQRRSKQPGHRLIDDWEIPQTEGYQPPSRKKRMLGLREEYRRAILTFGLLNAVLVVVNLTDLAYVWIPSGSLNASTLSHYVHVGTWNLTISIGLAMLVVLYFFRGNLNFLSGDRILRPLVRGWLAQNALLAVSVGVRNYHYIDAYGLALGRLYVGFVLLLMLFGLYTLLRKVDHKLSLSYLFQTNGLAAWLVLLAFAAVNWPGVITRYNLAAKTVAEVDWDYLRSGLDRRNSFLLLDHPEANIDLHMKTLPKTHARADWRSWNYADWRNYQATKKE